MTILNIAAKNYQGLNDMYNVTKYGRKTPSRLLGVDPRTAKNGSRVFAIRMDTSSGRVDFIGTAAFNDAAKDSGNSMSDDAMIRERLVKAGYTVGDGYFERDRKVVTEMIAVSPELNLSDVYCDARSMSASMFALLHMSSARLSEPNSSPFHFRRR